MAHRLGPNPTWEEYREDYLLWREGPLREELATFEKKIADAEKQVAELQKQAEGWKKHVGLIKEALEAAKNRPSQTF